MALATASILLAGCLSDELASRTDSQPLAQRSENAPVDEDQQEDQGGSASGSSCVDILTNADIGYGYEVTPDGLLVFWEGDICESVIVDPNRCEVLGDMLGIDLEWTVVTQHGRTRCGCRCEASKCDPSDDPTLTSYNAHGDGTPSNRYRVYNPAQLRSISLNDAALGMHYLQCADVDFAGFYSDDNKYFTIGTEPKPFFGAFDGNDYKIESFVYDVGGPFFGGTHVDELGLFGSMDGATLHNVKVYDATVRSPQGENIGTLVGFMRASEVSQSQGSGAVEGNETVGGLIGHASANSLIVESSAATNVAIHEYRARGLVGALVASTVAKSSASGNVAGDSADELGGFVGDVYANALIQDSFATGHVAGDISVGGFSGTMHVGVVSRCHATGEVAGTESVGGFSGGLFNSTLANVYSTGSVSGETWVGGFVGAAAYSSIANGYAAGSVAAQDFVGGFAGAGIGATVSSVFSLAQTIEGLTYVGAVVGGTQGGTFTNAYYWSGVGCANNNCNTDFATPKNHQSYFYSSNNAPLNLWDFVFVWEAVPGSTPVLK